MGLRTALNDLKAFGTDGEQALSNALQVVFKEQSIYVVFFTLKVIWNRGVARNSQKGVLDIGDCEKFHKPRPLITACDFCLHEPRTFK